VIGLDTNVLIRFLVEDDAEQHRRTVDLVRTGLDAGETFFIGDVVLAELVWVLRSAYRFTREEIAPVLRALFEAEHLQFESVDRGLRALRRYQEGRGDFPDFLIVERARDAGCSSVASFDRQLADESDVVAP